ncbi:MAG: hypothetical protein GOV01_02090 [Candidatus Altiarchaeota archaeon]|nr:hypothetical protein [Candidatus Altiarchaeota archaeon]
MAEDMNEPKQGYIGTPDELEKMGYTAITGFGHGTIYGKEGTYTRLLVSKVDKDGQTPQDGSATHRKVQKVYQVESLLGTLTYNYIDHDIVSKVKK